MIPQKKFRHLIDVDMQDHGSPLEIYSKSYFEGQEWIEIKPLRDLSIFEFDSKVNGMEQTPKVLFGRSKATFRYTVQGSVKYTNFPHAYDFLTFPFISPLQFAEKIRGHVKLFNTIKVYLNAHLANFTLHDHRQAELFALLKNWRNHTTNMLPYMFLTLRSDETIYSAFEASHTGDFKQKLSEFLFKECSTTYASAVFTSQGYVPIARNFSLPPSDEIPDILLPQTSLKYINDLLHDFINHLPEKSSSFSRRYEMLHRPLIRILFQITEDNYYVWQCYALMINHTLFKLQQSWNSKSNKELDLTRMTIAEILSYKTQRL